MRCIKMNIRDAYPGCPVEHKKGGIVANTLGFCLRAFEPWWDGWGWHLSILVSKGDNGCFLLEATGNGVDINYYTFEQLKDTRVYDWLGREPTRKEWREFIKAHKGKKYDVGIYFWSGLQYLIRHFFNHKIPRLLDDRYTCWELVFEFARDMDKPFDSVYESKYDCPLITDFIRAMESA